jgi:hypothetical protein
VDLGTMTAAGLVGTLHLDTPPVDHNYARRPMGRSDTFSDHIRSCYGIIAEKSKKVNLFFCIFQDFSGKNFVFAPKSNRCGVLLPDL